MSIDVSQLVPQVVEILQQMVRLAGSAGLAAGTLEVAKKIRDHLVPKFADKVWDRFTKDPSRTEQIEDEVRDVLGADDALADQVASLVTAYRTAGRIVTASSVVSNSRNVQVAQGSGNPQGMSIGRRDRESNDADDAEDD